MNAQRRRFGGALLAEQGGDVNAEVNVLQETLLQSCDTIVQQHEYTGGWLGLLRYNTVNTATVFFLLLDNATPFCFSGIVSIVLLLELSPLHFY